MLMEAIKRCTSCGADKRLSGFYANANGRCGRHALCKACMDVRKRSSADRYRAMGDDRLPQSKRCPMCQLEKPPGDFSRYPTSSDGLRTYCKECDRVVRRSDKYELERARVAEMLLQTQCEACGKVFADDAEKHIDHRHSDGAVRGVLCGRCNTTLGKCEENPMILMALCSYLSRTVDVDYRKQPYADTKTGEADICSLANTPPRLSEPNVRRADSGH